MPGTAIKHFNEDIARANALTDLAEKQPSGTQAEKLLRDDVLRSAWMLAVGALDAYYCDAYADLAARTLRAKSLQPSVSLPEFIKVLRLPAAHMVTQYPGSPNWRWRMAARDLITRDNVLSLHRAQELINPFFRSKKGLFSTPMIKQMMGLPGATAHVFSIPPARYSTLAPPQKKKAIGKAKERLHKRFKDIIQRRHDMIHNCDRPKVALQNISCGKVRNVIRDVQLVVSASDSWIAQGFPGFLQRLSCGATVRSQVLAGW